MESGTGEGLSSELIVQQEEWARQILHQFGVNPDEFEGSALVAKAMQLSKEAGYLILGNRWLVTVVNALVYQANRLAVPMEKLIERSNIPKTYYLGVMVALIFLVASNEVLIYVSHLPNEPMASSLADRDEKAINSLFNYTLHEMCSSEDAPQKFRGEDEEEFLNFEEKIASLLALEEPWDIPSPQTTSEPVAMIFIPPPEPDGEGVETEFIHLVAEEAERDVFEETFKISPEKTLEASVSSSARIQQTPEVKEPEETEAKTWGQLSRSLMVGTAFFVGQFPCIASEVANCLIAKNGVKGVKKSRKKKGRNGAGYKQRALFWGGCALGGGVLAAVTDWSVDSFIVWLNKKPDKKKSPEEKTRAVEKVDMTAYASKVSFFARNLNVGATGMGCEIEIFTLYSGSLYLQSQLKWELTSLDRGLAGVLAAGYYPMCRTYTMYGEEDYCSVLSIGTFIAALMATFKVAPELSFTFYNPLASSVSAMLASTMCRTHRHYFLWKVSSQ